MAGGSWLSSMTSWLGGLFGSEGTGIRGQGLSSASNAGERVTPDTALNLSTVYRCVRVVSESIAQLPCRVMEIAADGTETVSDDPLGQLLGVSPNADNSPFEVHETFGSSLCLWGNAYAIRDTLGAGSTLRTTALTPIRPDRVQPYRDPGTGAPRYRYVTLGGNQMDVGREGMLHVAGWGGGFNLLGTSPIGLARHGLGLGLAVETAASRYFSNGMRPSGFLTADRVFSDKQRKEMRLHMQEFQGSQSSGRYMVLEGGLKYAPLTLNPEEMQMLESRKFTVEEVCRWFGVPPFLAFSDSAGGPYGTGLEQQQLGFLIFSLMPYLERLEQALTKQLIPVADRGRLRVRYNVESLLRASLEAQAQYYQAMVAGGIMMPNEARFKLGLPPVPGGSNLFINSAFTTLTQAAKPKPPPPAFPPPGHVPPAAPVPAPIPPSNKPAPPKRAEELVS